MFSMGQARTRGTHFDRVTEAREREAAATRAEADRKHQEAAQRRLHDLATGIVSGGWGHSGPYDDNAALAMAFRHHGLRVAMVQ